MVLSRVLAVLLLVSAAFTGPVLAANTMGGDTVAPEDLPLLLRHGLPTDYREEKRRFVQAIGDFARRRNPDFVVIAEGGLDLVSKVEEDGSHAFVPANRYMRAIDGVLIEGLNFGHAALDTPTDEAVRAAMLARAREAKGAGLAVLVMDYGSTEATAHDAHRENAADGFVSLTADAPASEITALPSHPRRPFDENAANVLSLRDVRNFAYLGTLTAWDRDDAFALDMQTTNYDLLVVDAFLRRKPLGKRAVETLKYKKMGARRLVFARIDIGTAASYLYYWQPQWNDGRPRWMGRPLPSDPDRYVVEYWQRGWQEIIAGDENSFIHGVVTQGYDGVVLTGLDAFRRFEGGDFADTEKTTPTAAAHPISRNP
ncbi:MAG: hypothetical protein KIT00_01985 [Rhodospirillales bacterium]|nr:hypothetical protein [Rhodospirillales bacterium]